jgi:hypothetical protein
VKVQFEVASNPPLLTRCEHQLGSGVTTGVRAGATVTEGVDDGTGVKVGVSRQAHLALLDAFA